MPSPRLLRAAHSAPTLIAFWLLLHLSSRRYNATLVSFGESFGMLGTLPCASLSLVASDLVEARKLHRHFLGVPGSILIRYDHYFISISLDVHVYIVSSYMQLSRDDVKLDQSSARGPRA
eukprot:4745412-Amphidinium_carterae.1